MKAFHGDPKVKEKYLARVKAHRKADQIVQHKYWEDGKGRVVGCTIHGSNYQAYETELGIPIQLAYLQDWIFENLPNGEAKNFPVDFLESIPVGVDLKPVFHQFLHWLLVAPEDGVIQYAQDEEEEQVKEAILSVADLHNRVIKGQEVTNERWVAASGAARDAYWSARAAYWSAMAASRSSRTASRSVRAAASRSARAASDAVIKRQKEKLLELLAGESALHERGYGQVRQILEFPEGWLD